ncbi:MAG TPA: LysR family transcriptional regulator [Desulfobulbus sp.]|nr:LysR family transcriptional regulator [Desulfobulbus sp.]
MDLRKLEVFCTLVELKSFTKTAEAVLLSQPTVSEHIRNLEHVLGQKLVDRLGRQVEPTPVGKILYTHARRILRMQQEALQAVEEYSGRISGRIMIGCGTIPGTYLLPKLISDFRMQYPEIKATLHISSSRTIARKVMEGNLELGVVGARWNEPSLDWKTIFSDELSLVVHPKHRWTKQHSIDCRQLIDEPFILRETGSGTRRVIAQFLRQQGMQENDLQEVAEIGSTAAIKEAVKAGIGISILSRRAITDDLECGRLATVSLNKLRITRPFYLIRRRKRQLAPVATTFVDFLQDRADHQEKE